MRFLPPLPHLRVALMWAVMVCLTMLGSLAMAQTTGDGEVRLEVTRMGVGGLAREGSWAGLRVEVTDTGLASQRELVLRVRVTDPDGDEAEYDRVVTSNSGLPQAFWLYAQMPLTTSGLDGIEVLAFEAVESGDPRFGFKAGRLLGRVFAPTALMMPGQRGMMAVVGPNAFGLTGYGPTGRFESFLPKGHEITYLTTGLDASDIPDRWQGLRSFDVLVWGSTRDRADPGRLSADKSRAVRQWVESGGHLVVVLPSIGQEWFSQSGNPLAGLLPDILPPVSLEGVDLNDFRPLLTSGKADEVPLPSNAIVRVFEVSPDAGPGEAIPILNDAEGRCVVMRRILGGGAVTLIGFDLNQTMLRNLGLPEAGVFWHRVLGRRGELGSAESIEKGPPIQNLNELLQRSHAQLDVDISEQIALKGKAAFGVGLGVLVFVLYWLAAGPAGFLFLGRRGWKQHAWVVFVGVVGLFTAIAWLGATFARPHQAMVRHVTLLQGVYGQPTMRARSWQGMLIPYYGEASVTVANQPNGAPPEVLLSVFESSGSLLSLTGLPDNRPYRIESRDPRELRFPARSTVKELAVDWVGQSDWGLPEPVNQPGDLEEPILRIVREGEFGPDDRPLDSEASGELVHSLPGSLENVVILINKGLITLTEGGNIRGNLVSNVSAYELTSPWAPDVRLNLETVTKRQPGDGINRQSADAYLTALLRGERVGQGSSSRPDPRRLGERLEALALYPMLGPPSHVATVGTESRLAKRDLTHGYDLGLWFTQPSIMVIGQLRQEGGDARSPVPVALDGRVIRSEGTTLVMWVYPLPAHPPSLRFIGEDEVGTEG